ncbi:hypothetical protein PRZ48_009118 [Zasmidium cellare]|uniref:Heterokaryon incompatibility domain-containing protein n=1 Tax=Zasmidium cellare TaxID=395010 RepID=A0ABR0EHD9_ZASCE|nr:hypothetical protein PRZ48_009118 [Zasmidium cellare]
MPSSPSRPWVSATFGLIATYCILQGGDEASVQDWKTESVLMYLVYSNSTLNIGAHGKDAGAGCFQHRRQPREPGSLSIRWRRKHTEEEKIFEVYEKRVKDPDPRREFLMGPLLCRGWVVQERALCRRMLHFTAETGYPASELDPFGHHWKFSGGLGGPGTLIEAPSEQRQPGLQVREMWSEMLRHYTSTLLTKQSDKLVAFEGISRMLAELTGTPYQHGFLLNNLPYTLCWSYEDSETWDPDDRRKPLGWRPDGSFPSWHWASSNGTIYQQPIVDRHARYDRLWHSPLRKRHRTVYLPSPLPAAAIPLASAFFALKY